MTTKADYTPEEWQLLLDMPRLVGTAVMVADPSGAIGMRQESVALAKGLANGKLYYPQNELIQALSAEIDAQPPIDSHQPAEQIKATATEKCGQVADLLEKAPEREREEYKLWCLEVGEEVANAAIEGGFLGLGGDRVSQTELSTLLDLAEALRIVHYLPFGKIAAQAG